MIRKLLDSFAGVLQKPQYFKSPGISFACDEANPTGVGIRLAYNLRISRRYRYIVSKFIKAQAVLLCVVGPIYLRRRKGKQPCKRKSRIGLSICKSVLAQSIFCFDDKLTLAAIAPPFRINLHGFSSAWGLLQKNWNAVHTQAEPVHFRRLCDLLRMSDLDRGIIFQRKIGQQHLWRPEHDGGQQSAEGNSPCN